MSITKTTSRELSHIDFESVRSLLSGLVVGFRPEFAHIGRGTELGCIGIKAAMMLSQALWLTERRGDADGWFAYTLVEWFQVTGLSDEEQLTARRALKKRGLLQESDRGVDFTLHGRKRRTGGQKHYRIDFYALAAALDEVAEQGFLTPDGGPSREGGQALTLPTASRIIMNPAPSSIGSVPNSDAEESIKEANRMESDRAGNQLSISGRFQKVLPVRPGRLRSATTEITLPERQFPAAPGAMFPVQPGTCPSLPVPRGNWLPVQPGKQLPVEPEPPALYTESVKDKQQQQGRTTKMFVGVENLKNSNFAPLAPNPTGENPEQSVKAQLLKFTEPRNIQIASNEIEALLDNWPAAKLSDADLFGALTGDYELYSLDRPADERIARMAIKSDAARLRWFMCVWPGFEEASDAYHEKTGHQWTKAQCFWKRWKNAQPPENWLQCQLKALRATAERARVAGEAERYKTFWNALTAPQRRALDNETREVLNEEGGGEYFAQSSDEFLIKRRELLLDDEVREWLMDGSGKAPGLLNQIKAARGAIGPPEIVPVAHSVAQCALSSTPDACGGIRSELDGFHGVVGPDESSVDSDEIRVDLDESCSRSNGAEGETCAEEGVRWEYDKTDWTTRQLSIEVYIGPLMDQLRDRTLVLADMEERRPNLLDEDEWRFIKDETTRRAYAEKIVA